jgi:hypothetical protein
LSLDVCVEGVRGCERLQATRHWMRRCRAQRCPRPGGLSFLIILGTTNQRETKTSQGHLRSGEGMAWALEHKDLHRHICPPGPRPVLVPAPSWWVEVQGGGCHRCHASQDSYCGRLARFTHEIVAQQILCIWGWEHCGWAASGWTYVPQ